MAIYSEGAVSYSEAWQLSPNERAMLIKTLNKFNRLKSGKKSDEWLDD